MFALAGCSQRESANETAKDVAAARQDANQNVAEEKKEAADVATQSTEDRAAAEYDVAVAQADGQRKIAKEKCETLAGDAQKSCKDEADAGYESAKAQAQATLDAAKRSGSAATN
jgi:DNA-directed RNA polymerase beta subunit